MTVSIIFVLLTAICLFVVLAKAFFIKGEKPEKPGPGNNWEIKNRAKYQKGSGGYEADAGGI